MFALLSLIAMVASYRHGGWHAAGWAYLASVSVMALVYWWHYFGRPGGTSAS